MRNNYIDPRQRDFGPTPSSRPDSIIQGCSIGELLMSAGEDRLHDSFDHENWGEVRLPGAMPLREMMTRVDDLCRQNTDKRHCVLLPLTHEA